MTRIIKVAVPGPFRTPLDYLPPQAEPSADVPVEPGSRVSVPLGRRRLVGVVVGAEDHSSLDAHRLRRVQKVLDSAPILDTDILELAHWASEYYHHPLGEVLARCLPPRHRRPDAGTPRTPRVWQLTAAGLSTDLATLARTPAQARAVETLRAATAPQRDEDLRAVGIRSEIIRKLEQAGLIVAMDAMVASALEPPVSDDRPRLNVHQAAAADAIVAAMDSFVVSLLDGITGSGKTEVYLHAMTSAMAAGRQVLLLVPEIGLTPQAEQRLHHRFGSAVATLHSGMSDLLRLRAWERARRGGARILIGTRSAIFTPLPDLGLIVVDEEHDESFKQQDGLRYSARDLALVRARNRGIPVVLGSATPSLETLHNAGAGRYRHLLLPERAGGASRPTMGLVDLRRHPAPEGFAAPLQTAMNEALTAGNQVLVFLNRRGFAPVLRCSDCGWMADCHRCDARMTVHSRPAGLRCHHCGARRSLPPECPQCGAPEPMPIGQGTQRSEHVLGRHFPGTPVIRIDRDSTASQPALQAALDRIGRGDPCILVGTQMLAKGHHFPAVTLVAVLDADSGLFSADFRSSERLAQQILQVAGRAGRAERPGRVLIQTHEPNHPLWETLLRQDYAAFAAAALDERRQTGLPPFSHLALLRAEAPDRATVWAFLERTAACLDGEQPQVAVLGPVAALRERLAGRYRAQLLLQSPTRPPLHALLRNRLAEVEALPESRRVRWSLDVDPIDLY